MAAGTSSPGGIDLTRKLGPLPVWAWAAIGVGLALLYSKRSGGSSSTGTSTGTPQAGSLTTAQQSALLQNASLGAYGSGFGYEEGIGELGDMVSQLQSQVSQLQAGNSGTTSTPATSPGSTGNAAFNPYPVGTTVAPGSTITEAVQVPGGGWVDVASGAGGLYTSPGLSVSGSAAASPVKAPPGGYTATVNPTGTTVYEDTAAGVKTFALTRS